MSHVLRYTCDACGAEQRENPEPGRTYTSPLPTMIWKEFDGREFCSMACVAAYASDIQIQRRTD